jgi:hypothetical protein
MVLHAETSHLFTNECRVYTTQANTQAFSLLVCPQAMLLAAIKCQQVRVSDAEQQNAVSSV